MDMNHFSTSCRIRSVDQYELVRLEPHTQLMKSGKPQSMTGTQANGHGNTAWHIMQYKTPQALGQAIQLLSCVSTAFRAVPKTLIFTQEAPKRPPRGPK
eukprot:371472-Pyramimonas_sp.AAC.1